MKLTLGLVLAVLVGFVIGANYGQDVLSTGTEFVESVVYDTLSIDEAISGQTEDSATVAPSTNVVPTDTVSVSDTTVNVELEPIKILDDADVVKDGE